VSNAALLATQEYSVKPVVSNMAHVVTGYAVNKQEHNSELHIMKS